MIWENSIKLKLILVHTKKYHLLNLHIKNAHEVLDLRLASLFFFDKNLK